MKHSDPVIIVVAYNRPDSLKRILHSLLNGKEISDVRLIISIDNQEPYNLDVKEVADSFYWPFGAKEVRYQKEHLGLKKHIMQNGSLAIEFGSVIILEDDLLVSPYFYQYARAALQYYHEDESIGGISLYNQPRHEIVKLPFTPIGGPSDTFFIQFPSSLGQLWTREQWTQFKTWYESKPDISDVSLPSYILNWPESSWKKLFAAYLLDRNKFFVYPRISLTTNFFDQGENIENASSHRGQTPLRIFNSAFKFIPFEESNCVYDINLELLARCVKSIDIHNIDYDYELDLYGSKEIHHIRAPYVITSRPSKKKIKGFMRALKPHEMNIIMGLEGSDFILCKTEDVIIRKQDSKELLEEFQYYYTDFIKGSKFMVFRHFQKWKWLRNLFS